jgi:hypothetical protein
VTVYVYAVKSNRFAPGYVVASSVCDAERKFLGWLEAHDTGAEVPVQVLGIERMGEVIE